MPAPTDQDRVALEAAISLLLQSRREPRPRLLVSTLGSVGMGYLAGSFGTFPPVSRREEREQIAAFLVSTYLQGTRPSPNNNYLAIVMQSVAAYVGALSLPVAVPEPVRRILATLGLGFTRETDPRATRAAAANHFVDLFLDGA